MKEISIKKRNRQKNWSAAERTSIYRDNSGELLKKLLSLSITEGEEY